MSLPQVRSLTDSAGFRWTVTVDAGRLVLAVADGSADPIVFDRPEELRALAPQIVRAVTQHDLDVQEAAVKASIARRHARIAAGGPRGNRHRPVVEHPEPALVLDPEVRA